METAILSLAVLILAIACAVLAGSVPWLWWKFFKLEQRTDEVDETLAELLKQLGFKTNLEGDWQNEVNGRNRGNQANGETRGALGHPKRPEKDENRY